MHTCTCTVHVLYVRVLLKIYLVLDLCVAINNVGFLFWGAQLVVSCLGGIKVEAEYLHLATYSLTSSPSPALKFIV